MTKKEKELKEAIVKAVGDEVTELLSRNWEKISGFIAESDSESTTIGFATTINLKQSDGRVKTIISFSQRIKDSEEDVIGDPDQPEFDGIDKESTSKKSKKKSDESA